MGTQRQAAQPATPQRSPARAALANVISRRRIEARRFSEAQTALLRVNELVRTAEAKLTAALDTAKTKRDRHSELIHEAAKNNTPLPDGTAVRAAIDAVHAAEDERDAAIRAQSIAQSAMSAIQETLAEAEQEVATAADQVIRAEAHEPLRRAITAARAALRELQAAAYFLEHGSDYWTSADGILGFFPNKAAKYAVTRLSGICVDDQDLRKLSTYGKWLAVREALRRDPDAPLPLPDVSLLGAGTDDPPAAQTVNPVAAMVMVNRIREANGEAVE